LKQIIGIVFFVFFNRSILKVDFKFYLFIIYLVIFARNLAAFDSDSTQTNIGISCNTISYLSAVSVHIQELQESTTNNDDQGSQVHFDIVDNLEMGDAEPVDHI
jgi:uncharacterized membrane protein YoaT (DUF817 family)